MTRTQIAATLRLLANECYLLRRHAQHFLTYLTGEEKHFHTVVTLDQLETIRDHLAELAQRALELAEEIEDLDSGPAPPLTTTGPQH